MATTATTPKKGTTAASRKKAATAKSRRTTAKGKAATITKGGETMTVKAACYAVLSASGKPMHYQEIAKRVLEGSYPLRRRGGKTFPASVRTELAVNPAMFEKVAPGVYVARAAK